jgi:uncharacterized protein YjeT (DUF2065 family)
MGVDLLTGFALLLVISGILPFMNPTVYRRTMQQLLSQPDQTIRSLALVSMVAGVILLYLVN